MFQLAFAFPPESSRLRRVLFVEDHEDTRLMYAEFLSASFEVLQATDAQEALSLACTQAPDVIVTDMSLPGMDGFELIKQIRRTATTSRIPVVCLSGHSGQVYEERARKAGCDRIVQKPCLPDALADTLQQLLNDLSQRSGS